MGVHMGAEGNEVAVVSVWRKERHG
jgi:hypothetical protein